MTGDRARSFGGALGLLRSREAGGALSYLATCITDPFAEKSVQ